MNKDDLEEELARILQEEIWREITAETGKTQNDLDEEMLAAIRQVMKRKAFGAPCGLLRKKQE